MKIATLLPQPRSIIPLAGLLMLAACDSNPGPGYEIHDTKYVAIGEAGEQLDPSAGSGACVLDQFTGLLWEVKSDRPGLHDKNNTYTWYNPDESHDGELDYRGTEGGGACSGSACDTWAYVNAVNEVGHCSYSDWRIPSRDALASISDLRKIENPPTINMQYFPNTEPAEYWSGNDYDFQWNAAWLWNFQFGHDRVDWKQSPKYVRLVRGEAQALPRIED